MSMDEPNTELPLSRDNISCTVLPQDVMDSIVDMLADLAFDPDNHDPDARIALAQCLLVSRSFYSKARPRVFHSITRKEQILPCEKWDQRRDNLFFDLFEGDLLREFRPLASQVHELTIAACFPTTDKMILLDGWSSSQEELNRHRERLPRILNTMVNLEALEIRSDGHNPLIWATLYSGTKSSIRKICRTVKILRFHKIWGFPLSILSVCVNIKELSLSNITGMQAGIGNWLQKGLDDLEVLEIAHVDEELLSKIVTYRPNAFSRLKRLKVTLPHVTDLSTVLQCSLNSLKTLEIFMFQDNFSFHPDTKFKLAALRTLSTLRLHLFASLALPECFPPQILTFFVKGLVDNSPSSLENLILEFVVRTSNNALDHQNILPLAWQKRWAKLDSLLTSRGYPSLETMSIKFIERRSTIVTHRIPSSDGGVYYSNTLHVDGSELMKLERESLTWLRKYFETALPRLHTSTATMRFKYCIITGEDCH